MGAYCHSYGYHLAGKDHASTMCQYKKWNNTLGGNNHWPKPKRVSNAQEHTTYKNKSKQTA
jgi:hypothetical protein